VIQTSNQNEFQLRSIKKGGHIRGRLRHGGVSLVLKARIAHYLEACGYTPDAASDEAAKFCGHSGRVGMYTAASRLATQSRPLLRLPGTSR
jgi:hypothetical protein